MTIIVCACTQHVGEKYVKKQNSPTDREHCLLLRSILSSFSFFLLSFVPFSLFFPFSCLHGDHVQFWFLLGVNVLFTLVVMRFENRIEKTMFGHCLEHFMSGCRGAQPRQIGLRKTGSKTIESNILQFSVNPDFFIARICWFGLCD